MPAPETVRASLFCDGFGGLHRIVPKSRRRLPRANAKLIEEMEEGGAHQGVQDPQP